MEISGVVFDGVAVVNEQVVFKDATINCKDLADHVVRAVQRNSYSYTGAYVVSDDYSVGSSLKDKKRMSYRRKIITKLKTTHVLRTSVTF